MLSIEEIVRPLHRAACDCHRCSVEEAVSCGRRSTAANVLLYLFVIVLTFSPEHTPPKLFPNGWYCYYCTVQKKRPSGCVVPDCRTLTGARQQLPIHVLTVTCTVVVPVARTHARIVDNCPICRFTASILGTVEPSVQGFFMSSVKSPEPAVIPDFFVWVRLAIESVRDAYSAVKKSYSSCPALYLLYVVVDVHRTGDAHPMSVV